MRPAASGPDAPPARSLISRLTHALGTPLGSVQISAELLARDPDGRLGERERRLVENIRQANAEVQELLRQVGRLARAREARLRLLVEEVDAGELLADVGRRLAASLGERAAVELAPPPAAVRFLADRGALAEVVETLVAALLPGGGEGGGARVRVTVAPLGAEAAGETGEVGVAGRGEPAAAAPAGSASRAAEVSGRDRAAVLVAGTGAVPRLDEPDFEPLSDAGADSSRGLALALARALVEAQDGTLAVEPSADGTTFRLALPLAVPPPGSRPAER